MSDERRQFNRVIFNSRASFHSDKNKVDCRIIDLSVQGAYLTLLDEIEVEIGRSYHLEIPLGQADEVIVMVLKLVHKKDKGLGLMCTHIDLDSITHLKRLLELNLGDSNLLERDFNALLNDDH